MLSIAARLASNGEGVERGTTISSFMLPTSSRDDVSTRKVNTAITHTNKRYQGRIPIYKHTKMVTIKSFLFRTAAFAKLQNLFEILKR